MNLKETLRYLGYKDQEADEQTLKLIGECWEELEQKAERRACFREFPLVFKDDGIDVGCFQTESRALRKNLRGCNQVVLFAATLGIQADNLIRRYGHFQMSKAVVLQAAAAAMLEDYCDQVNEELRLIYEKRGLLLRPRFSPGYGDFPLECQPALIRGLEAGKRIGITLTDSLLMIPSKSVTAVIGVGSSGREDAKRIDENDGGFRPDGAGKTSEKKERYGGKCALCANTDCLYRRKII